MLSGHKLTWRCLNNILLNHVVQCTQTHVAFIQYKRLHRLVSCTDAS
jgi:hypothetical protein